MHQDENKSVNASYGRNHNNTSSPNTKGYLSGNRQNSEANKNTGMRYSHNNSFEKNANRGVKSKANVDDNTAKCNTPAAIVCVVMFLFVVAEFLLRTDIFKGQNPYVVLVIIQFLVFILPCAFFSATKNYKTSTELSTYNFRLFSPKLFGFIFSALAVILFGTMLLKYLGYVLFGFVNSTTVIYENHNVLALIASTVLVPAVVEEILIRGIVFTEYEKKVGVFGAIIGSSFLFALIHFDIKDFLSYFFAGIILATVLHVTRSLLATITVHLLNNIICLFTDTFLKRVSKESVSSFFVVFLLTVLLLLALFAMFETLEWICSAKADSIANGKHSKTNIQTSRLIPHNTKFSFLFSSIFTAPSFFIALFIYFIRVLFLN